MSTYYNLLQTYSTRPPDRSSRDDLNGIVPFPNATASVLDTDMFEGFEQRLKELVHAYLDDAYGPGWARWFFGAGGEIDSDEEDLKNKLKSGIMLLASNIQPDTDYERIDSDTIFQSPGPWGSLRVALLDLSVTFFTGLREGPPGPDGDAANNLLAPQRSIYDEIRRNNQASGFGDIYSPGSELTTFRLLSFKDILEEFLESNDKGEWEDT